MNNATNIGGILIEVRGTTAADRAVVAMLKVTGVTPVALTEEGLNVQVAAAGSPLQAKVTAPSPPA